MSEQPTCPTCGQQVEWNALTFGARIRLLREGRGWSQREAANQMGIPQTTLSSYEKRDGWPDEDICRKLADAYVVTVGVILGLESLPAPGRAPKEESTGR